MSSAVSKIGFFLFGVGSVNVLAFPYLKEYQIRNEVELKSLIATHQAQVLAFRP
jgi:hypothetical protein